MMFTIINFNEIEKNETQTDGFNGLGFPLTLIYII